MFCSPLGCAAYRAHAKQIAFASRHLAFVPCSSKVALVSSRLSVSLGFRICPNCACTQPFLVPCSFPVFCHSRRGVFRCKHCNKGSQVPGLSHRSVVSDSCDPMDYSSLGSSVHGVSQARILGWVAVSFSRGSSPPTDET